MKLLKVLGLLLLKDLRIELRSKELLATMLLFGAVLTMVLAYGFINDPEINRGLLPAALWIALLFTGSLGIGRTFAREAEYDAFSALILSPTPPAALLLSKILGNLLLISLVMLLVAPILIIMLHIEISGVEAAQLLLIFGLGALGFVLVGTPMAVMAVNARFAEVLLPMVVFPLISPILISGAQGASVILGTSVGTDPWPWIQLILAFDWVYGVGGLLLFSRMVSE